MSKVKIVHRTAVQGNHWLQYARQLQLLHHDDMNATFFVTIDVLVQCCNGFYHAVTDYLSNDYYQPHIF